MKKILIANVGSTSYKYTLFDIDANGASTELVRGGIERVTDYVSAIEESLQDLKGKGYESSAIDAVAFKTVLGKDVSGLREADDTVPAVRERHQGFRQGSARRKKDSAV